MDVGILQLRRGAELNARVHGRTIEQQKDGPRAERLRQLLHELQHSRDIAPVVCAVAHEHIGTGQGNVGQRFGCFNPRNELRPTSRSMRLACQQTRQLGPRVSNTYRGFSAFASTIIGGRTQANCSLVCVHPPLQRDCFLSGHPIQLPLQVNAHIVHPVLCESRTPLQPNPLIAPAQACHETPHPPIAYGRRSRRPLQPKPLIAPAQACHETPHPPFAYGRRDAKGNELIRENLADAVTGGQLDGRTCSRRRGAL